MFKVTTEKRQFTHDVPIMEPVDGGFREDKLKTTFNALDKDAVAKFDLTTSDGTSAFLDAIVDRFHDLIDDDDKPLPVDGEARTILLARQNVRQGLVLHYFEAIRKVKEGN